MAVKTKKTKKPIFLKQYLVAGAPAGSSIVTNAVFIFHTCPKFAADEFRKKFPRCSVWLT